MPLLIDRDEMAARGRSLTGSAHKGSLARIVSGMKVSTSRSDSVGLDRFMRDMSALFCQDQVEPFGAKSSAL
ncbi:MAG: hypothetical protein HQL72_09505 [Magnetococcales bacterium]|nr:hypothetical protein [Magnetococcales bacterium]